MILEVAQLDIAAGRENTFEHAVAEAVPLFRQARGCLGFELQRSITHPSRYWIIVKWDTVENHTVDFRASPQFAEWRRLAKPCYANEPMIEHTRVLLKGF
jgi:quinol monooxygenase YgiN